MFANFFKMEKSIYSNEMLLIKELKKGSEPAFEFFFMTYHGELCSYLTAICGNTKMAEEIAQQAFIKLWHKRHKLHLKKGLKRYFFKMAYHLFIDDARKRNKTNKLLETLKQQAYIAVLDYDNELFELKLKKIEIEIDNLPEQCKKVFLMGKKEGLKYKEISRKLQISIKTVEVHMSKALKILRSQFVVIPKESN